MRKGISIISLVVIITIITILSSVVIVNSYNSIQQAERTKFAIEITTIQEAVNDYLANNGTYPVSEVISVDIRDINEESLSQFSQEEPDNIISLSRINMELIGIENTNFGKGISDTDVYVVSTLSGKVYYLEGLKYKNKIYYTYTEDMINNMNLINNVSYNEINRQGIIFLSNNKKYTNLPVEVTIKIPEKYTNVLIEVTNNKSISSGDLINEYKEYNINKTSVDKTGNYRINVSFTLNGEQFATHYIVKNHDNITPNITSANYNGRVNGDGSTTKFISDILLEDNLSGVKVAKYELDSIEDMEYFSAYGKQLNSSTIQLSSNGKCTIYVEDNAGNKTIKILDAFKDNAPLLATGMTPIKWDVNGNVITTTSIDPAWYNYANKQWANAVSKDSGGNIIAYWVWIPRYEYKIPFPHTSTAQTIDVNFLEGKQTTPTSGYIIHPAFTFGDVEVTGIWVAKFKSSGPHLNMTIKPGTTINSGLSIETMFNACISMKTNSIYGWTTSGLGLDTHLMKNVEWGAAAYLSQSRYGKNGKIETVSNKSYAGGGTGDSYKINASQSTTGNVYGIYDMSGGRWEYVAAYIDNGSPYLELEGASLVWANEKYKDVYKVGAGNTSSTNYEENADKKGDAVYETSMDGTTLSSWYNDYSKMPSTAPFFCRGGDLDPMASVGIFSFYYYDGADYGGATFRPTLLVDSAL